MPPPVANNKQRLITIYVLIALGFAGLIGAHEISGPDENSDLTLPFIPRRGRHRKFRRRRTYGAQADEGRRFGDSRCARHPHCK